MVNSWNWKVIFAVLWLVFTLCLAAWWGVFTMGLIDQMSYHLVVSPEKLIRQKKMIFWEGLTWMGVLAAGGLPLIYLLLRDAQRTQQLKGFFAAFSHDLKTSLASVRLQTESLLEDFSGHDGQPLIQRLAADTGRIELQLENALFLAQVDKNPFYTEQFDVTEVLERIQHQWPQLTLKWGSLEPKITFDRRALEVILRNILQNAVVHGKATVVEISTQQLGDYIKIIVLDNGKGFEGHLDQLGQRHHRRNPQSGSGMGLYIVQQLMRAQSGRVHFYPQERGFQVELNIKKVHR